MTQDLQMHDFHFHFFSSHWHKIHSTFNLKMKWYCKRLRGALANIQHWYVLLHSASQRPQGSFPFPMSLPLESDRHWTVSAATRAEKSSDLMPFDHSLPSLSTERAMISWCCLLSFKSCKDQLIPSQLISLVVPTFYYQLKLLSPSYLRNWV